MDAPAVVNELTLLSVDKVHGYAFVRNGDGEIFGVEPPYLAATIRPAHESDVARSFDYAHGQPANSGNNRIFQSWDELWQWLDQEFVAERTRLRLPLPSSTDTGKYFRECSVDDVRHGLDIVRSRAIPEQRYEWARKIVASLLTATVLESEPEVKAEVQRLEEQVRLLYGNRLGKT